MKCDLFPSSEKKVLETTYSLAIAESGQKVLVVKGKTAGFSGTEIQDLGLACPLSSENAAILKSRLPWLNPVPLGLSISAGLGDRLGMATPGHVAAIRETKIAPIYAQQSVRENARTHRTPQQVMDDAMWGVFQSGWDLPWGADADHLKVPSDIPPFVSAGYTFFTIDPGDHVDNSAQFDSLDVLSAKFSALPWDVLDTSPEATLAAFTKVPFDFQDFTLKFSTEVLYRSAVKYSKAVAHAVNMYRHLILVSGSTRPFELEVSLDETDQFTSIFEHFYVASELNRLGIPFVSLALRFPGRMEKGVDYIGSLSEFETELAKHAIVQKFFGSYKLSLHSGSDKFSLYPLFARYCKERFHLKTAGTSYLEGLRVIAAQNPTLFRNILSFAIERYTTDRATYFVSGELENIPPIPTLQEEDLPALLDQFDARQVLHVTFGSTMDHFGAEIRATLSYDEALYSDALLRHIRRHLLPFQGVA